MVKKLFKMSPGSWSSAWVDFLQKRAGWVCVFLLALTVWSFSYASRVQIDGNIIAFLPQHMQSVEDFKIVLNKIGGYGNFIVILEGKSAEENVKFARALVPKLRELRWVSFVDFEANSAVFEKNKLLFASPDDLKDVLGKIDTYISQYEKIKIAKKIGFLTKEEAEEDMPPFPFEELDTKNQQRSIPQQHYHDAAHKTLMIPVWPRGITSDMGMANQALQDLNQLLETTKQTTGLDVSGEVGGEFRNKIDEIGAIVADLKSTSIWSTIAILVLITVSYLSPSALFFIILPLSVGMIWNTGLIYLMFGKINLMTIFLFGILFGLGIEYGIHFYGRYREEKEDPSKTMPDILKTILCETGRSCWISALATSGAFFSLTLTKFTGIRTFGLIVGVGILCVYFAMVTVFPAIFILYDRYQGILQRLSWKRLLHFEKIAAVRLEAWHDRILERQGLIRGMTWGVLLAGLSFTIFSFAAVPSLQFENDFNKVDVHQSTFQRLEKKIEKVFKDSRTPALVLVNSLDEVRQVEAALREKMAQPHSTIENVKSILDFLPQDQEKKLAIIAQIKQKLEPYRDFLEKRGGDKFREMYQLLEVQKTDFQIDDLPPSLKRVFIGNPDIPGYLVHIYEGISLRNAKEAIRYADEIRDVRVGDRVWHPASETLVYTDVLKLMKPETVRMLLLVTAGVVLMLVLQFRNIKDCILVFAPMLMVMIWILGWMRLYDIKFNAFNLVIFPIILGVNIDNFVYIYCRYQAEKHKGVGWAVRVSARSIMVSLLTTMLSFASLAAANHTGLHSIGIIAICGFGSCLLASLIFFPALLQFFHAGEDSSLSDDSAEVAKVSPPALSPR